MEHWTCVQCREVRPRRVVIFDGPFRHFVMCLRCRIQGLEAQSALLIMTSNYVHILNGFKVKSPSTTSTTAAASVKRKGHGHHHIGPGSTLAAHHHAHLQTATSQYSLHSMVNNNNDKTVEFVGSSINSSSSSSNPGGFNWATNAPATVSPRERAERIERLERIAGVGALAGLVEKQMAEETKWTSEVWEDLLSSDFGYSRMALKDVRFRQINNKLRCMCVSYD
jgi:hypothetical protein